MCTDVPRASSRCPHVDRAEQFGLDQRADDLQAEPGGVLHGEPFGQADPVIGHDDVELLRRPLDRDGHLAPGDSGTKACCSAFCTTSASTITSGVASSAPRMPKVPIRRTLAEVSAAATSLIIGTSRSTI